MILWILMPVLKRRIGTSHESCGIRPLSYRVFVFLEQVSWGAQLVCESVEIWVRCIWLLNRLITFNELARAGGHDWVRSSLSNCCLMSDRCLVLLHASQCRRSLIANCRPKRSICHTWRVPFSLNCILLSDRAALLQWLLCRFLLWRAYCRIFSFWCEAFIPLYFW